MKDFYNESDRLCTEPECTDINQHKYYTAWDLDGDPSTFNDAELLRVQQMFIALADFYSPYEVDITTAEPSQADLKRLAGDDDSYGVRVLVSDGGIDPNGSYMWDRLNVGIYANESPVRAMASNHEQRHIGQFAAAGLLAHEFGHNIGGRHVSIERSGSSMFIDEIPLRSIYGPEHMQARSMMGPNFSQHRSVWSFQDILNTTTEIATRPDDFGDDLDSAAQLLPSPQNNGLARWGIIEHRQ